MNRVPFLLPLLGVAFGIFLQADFFQGYWFISLTIGGALVIWLLSFLLSKDPSQSYKFSFLHFIWITILFLEIGASDFLFRASSNTEKPLLEGIYNFTGTVDEINYLSEGDRLSVKVTGIRDSLNKVIKCHNVKMLVKTDGFQASKGDIVNFSASPLIIDPESSSYNKRLFHKGYSYSINLRQNKIERIGKASSLRYKFHRWRESLIILLEKSSLNRHTGEFLISVLLGEKTLLSEDTRDTLSSSGMAHILALSGLHVAIILSILLIILFPLSLMGYPKTRRVLALIFIWLYVLLTGAAPSTVRAALMASVLLGAIILERKNSALNSLLAAAFFILIADPWSLWDIGFQLSFFCVLSIILFVNRLNPIEHHNHPLSYKFFGGVLTTLVTTIFTWVIISFYFKKVPLLFLCANVILLPLLPVFVGTGFIYLALLSFGIDFIYMAKFLDIFHDCMLVSAGFLSLGGKAVWDIEVPVISVILWISGMILAGVALNSILKKSRKTAWAIAASLLIVAISLPMLYRENESSATLRFNHSFTKIEVAHLGSDKVSIHQFPRNGIASLDTEHYHILSIDSPFLDRELDSRLQGLEDRIKFLVVGPEAELHQIADLISRGNFNTVILHTNVGKKKKAELLSLLDEKNWDNIYSLRDQGSLEFNL